MSARHKARTRALEILFEAHIRAVDPLEVLAAREAEPGASLNVYVGELVRGVCEHGGDINERAAQFLHAEECGDGQNRDQQQTIQIVFQPTHKRAFRWGRHILAQLPDMKLIRIKPARDVYNE